MARIDGGVALTWTGAGVVAEAWMPEGRKVSDVGRMSSVGVESVGIRWRCGVTTVRAAVDVHAEERAWQRWMHA